MGHSSGTLTHLCNTIGQFSLILSFYGIRLRTSSSLSDLIGRIKLVESSSRFRLRISVHSEQCHWYDLLEKLYPPKLSPLAHSSENFNCSSDLIDQIKLIVLYCTIRLKTSAHFEQYYWLIYLAEKLYLVSVLLLTHILDQYLYLKICPN